MFCSMFTSVFVRNIYKKHESETESYRMLRNIQVEDRKMVLIKRAFIVFNREFSAFS